MLLDHVNIQNNTQNQHLIDENWEIFKEIVLKKGYESRSLSDTERQYFHRYIDPKSYDPAYKKYKLYKKFADELKISNGGYRKILDHPRYYTTGDGKNVQLCSLYCRDLKKHDMLINDGWVVISPIYSTQARTYMRFVNIDVMRLQIEEDILKMKIKYCEDKILFLTNVLEETSKKNRLEQIRLEKFNSLLAKTRIQLDTTQQKISTLKEIDHTSSTDISSLLIAV